MVIIMILIYTCMYEILKSFLHHHALVYSLYGYAISLVITHLIDWCFAGQFRQLVRRDYYLHIGYEVECNNGYLKQISSSNENMKFLQY